MEDLLSRYSMLVAGEFILSGGLYRCFEFAGDQLCGVGDGEKIVVEIRRVQPIKIMSDKNMSISIPVAAGVRG